jgi:TolB protein
MALVATAALGAGAAQARPGLAYQFTHSINDSPSYSPDGKRIVFITVIESREQLFVMNADGSRPVQITRDDADHEDPAWSPDGGKIAYVSMKEGTEVIHLINPDGSGDEALTPSAVKVIHPSWAPDSQSLVYCTDDDLAPPRKNEADIVSIDLRTRKTTTLITGGVNTYPKWSPDGSKLTFRRMLGEMNSEVFVAERDGSNPRNLTNHPSFDGWPAWSPDGRQIAFASNRHGIYEVFVMKADGSDVRKVAGNDGRATAPAWSPDGRTILFPVCSHVAYGADCQIFAAEPPPPTA